MTTIIRQKLGSSKTRLLKKIEEIHSVLDDEEKIMRYDAVRILMELEKKLRTFQHHVAELEVAVRNDETESDRFAKDYDAYDDILNTAEDYKTKLEFIINNRAS